ncbi:MAG: M4 family metallopeptidase [Pseudomonadota bacterium]
MPCSRLSSVGPLPLLALLVGCGQPVADGPARRALFSTGSDEELDRATQLGLEALVARVPDVGVLDPTRVVVDDLGMAHARFRQTLGGVPVFGGEAIVHLHDDGSVASVTDDLVPDPEVDTHPEVDADEAVELALLEALGWAELTRDPEVDLWVLRHDRTDSLVWRVRLERIDGRSLPTRPVLFIDAHSGEVVWGYDDLHTGTGTTNYYGTVTIGTYDDGSYFYLEDTARDIGTYSANDGTSSIYYIVDDDDVWEISDQHNGVEGHYAAAAVHDYYLETFGRDGIDGSGGPGYVPSLTGSGDTLSVIVDYGWRYANAFWAGDYMVVGSGDGSVFTSLSTIDIIGHEMTHGVTERTAALIYADESGALDEAIADIFGSMVERYALGESDDTWTMGEECYTPSIAGDAIRYMADPTADGTSHDHYDDRYTGPLDNGGVHDNAGIGYLAYYLTSQGGQHPTYPDATLWGIGADATAAIWYRALTTYMTSGTDFDGAREATLSAAADLHGAGSVEYGNVALAWKQVGVGCHLGAPGAYNYCAADCTCGEGEGACDSDAECDGGLVCVPDAGASYGLSWWVDVCAPEPTDCHPSAVGTWNYCSDACTCAEGEGGCDGDTECDEGLVCTPNAGASYGLSWWVDVCTPAPADCHPSAVGTWNYCSVECPCAEGEGGCDNDTECDEGLTCRADSGASYGLNWWVDVCAPAPADCHPSAVGTWNYCSAGCPCAEGEGGCDNDIECESGLICAPDHGAPYGLNWWVDVCVP